VSSFKERRTAPEHGKLHPEFRDPRTGLCTIAALQEFIQYEIDGGVQTEAHERFVSPVCVAAVGIDHLSKIKDLKVRSKMIDFVEDAIQKVTRRSDRLARSGNDFAVLLRRTLAARARDFYGPNLTRLVSEAAAEAGAPTTVSVGIASLTEHLVRGAEDMLKKAFIALEEARKQGPGSVVVYDFRKMPY
jgi:diguanylate cyclase (GGDEF)-like protein